MWIISTPLEGLGIPTDTDGRHELAGQAPPWHHLGWSGERRGTPHDDAFSAAACEWHIRSWYEHGKRIYFRGASEHRDGLLERVRATPRHTHVSALFRAKHAGEQHATIQLTVVASPERFAQYEALIRFAMALPSGSVSLALQSPIVVSEQPERKAKRTALGPGGTTHLDGLEITVTRAAARLFTRKDLKDVSQLPHAVPQADDPLVDAENDHWHVFRRHESVESEPADRDAE